MFEDAMKSAWKRADAATVPLTRDAIEALLRPAARRTGRSLVFLVRTHVVMLVVTVLLALANLPGYRGNPVMIAVEALLALVSGAFAAFGLRFLAALRRVERADVSLLEAVEGRLAVHDRWFGPWLATASASPWLLSMGINTLVDNESGTYRVNHGIEFAVVTAVTIGLTYVLSRVAANPTLSEMRAVVHDLRAEALEATPGIEPLRRRAKTWLLVGTVVLMGGVLVGVWLWIRNTRTAG